MLREICLFALGAILGSFSLTLYLQITITAFCALPELQGMRFTLDGIFDIKRCIAKFHRTFIFNLIIVGIICAAVLAYAPLPLEIGFFVYFGIFGASGIMKSGSSTDANRMELGKYIAKYFRHNPGTEEVAQKILQDFTSPIQDGEELREDDKAVFNRERSFLRLISCVHFAICACVVLSIVMQESNLFY